jgi:polyisoprenoid-binding protein YceI
MRVIPLAFVAVLIASPAAAASWSVDYGHSKLGFSVPWGGQPYIAMFQKWNARIDFDAADLAHAKADVTIDMTSALSGEDDLDQNLPGPEGFDAGRFPQAHFVTKRFSSTGSGRYEAVADLTIHGVTKEITLPFTLKIDGDHAHMTGAVTLLRTDFGVGMGKGWAGETPVAHAVKVTFDLTASKAR